MCPRSSIKVELEFLSRLLIGASMEVRRARMDNDASFFAASWPQCPDPKHFTTVASSSSPIMKYGGAIVCASYM